MQSSLLATLEVVADTTPGLIILPTQISSYARIGILLQGPWGVDLEFSATDSPSAPRLSIRSDEGVVPIPDAWIWDGTIQGALIYAWAPVETTLTILIYHLI